MADTLYQFFAENPINGITDDVIVSERLKAFPFKIKTVSGDQWAKYQKETNVFKKGGKLDFDQKRFHELLILNHCEYPNFKDAEQIKAAGCVTPEQFLNKCLLAGEIVELANQISILSGFDSNIEELRDQAKNS